MVQDNNEKSFQIAVSKRDELLTQAKTIQISSCNVTGSQIEWGVAPFIREKGIFFIYVSELGRHVRFILNRNPVLFSIVEDEVSAKNIWARVRLKFKAEIREIKRDSQNFQIISDKIASRHGNVMNIIKDFSDFHLFSITPLSGTIVTGFGSAYKVTGIDFKLSDQPSSNS